MNEPELRHLLFDRDVLLGTVFSLSAVLSIGIAGFTFARLYRYLYRTRILSILQLSDARDLRWRLERLLVQRFQPHELKAVEREVNQLIVSLGFYSVQPSPDAMTESRRVALIKLLSRARFPMLLVSAGELSDCVDTDKVDATVISEVIIKRELYRAQSVSLAVKALGVDGKQQAFRIQRMVVAGNNRRLSIKVLKNAIATGSDFTRSVAQEGLIRLRAA